MFDRLFLALLILVDVLHHERPDDPIVEETDVSLAVTDSYAGYAHQAAHPMLVHRSDYVVSTLREERGGSSAARPQHREHGILTGYSRLEGGCVQRVPFYHPERVIFRGQCRYLVALR